MCEACAAWNKPTFSYGKMEITKYACRCQCPNTVFTPDGPRCEKCNHILRIEITDDGDSWGDTVPWMVDGQPVKLSEVQPTE